MSAQILGAIISAIYLFYAFKLPSPWHIIWSLLVGYYLYKYANGVITERANIKALKETAYHICTKNQ